MKEIIERYVKNKIVVYIPTETKEEEQTIKKEEDYNAEMTFGFEIEEGIIKKLHRSLVMHKLIKLTDYESFRFYFNPYYERPPYLSKIYWNSRCKGSVEVLLHRIFIDSFEDEKQYRKYILPKIPYIFRTWDRKPLTLYNKSSLPYNDERDLKFVFEEVYGDINPYNTVSYIP